jgi:hypothetical protein
MNNSLTLSRFANFSVALVMVVIFTVMVAIFNVSAIATIPSDTSGFTFSETRDVENGMRGITPIEIPAGTNVWLFSCRIYEKQYWAWVWGDGLNGENMIIQFNDFSLLAGKLPNDCIIDDERITPPDAPQNDNPPARL